MRIVSDFHDYYDVAQSTGQDQDLLYVRKPEEVRLKWEEYPFPTLTGIFPWRPRRWIDTWYWGKILAVEELVVGFCGKIYPVIKLTTRDVAPSPPTFCHRLDHIDAFVEGSFRKHVIEAYRKRPGRRRWHRPQPLRMVFEAFLATCDEKRDAFAELFLENRCPVFVACREPPRIVYHACLREVEFYRVFDPYTAYQEIAMYLGGLARPQKEIPEVPDKTLAEAKGFDKWSFRKPPSRPD